MAVIQKSIGKLNQHQTICRNRFCITSRSPADKMRIIPKILFLTIAVLVLVLSSTSASAVDVVSNGGFETGDFTGWILRNGFVTSYWSHSGTYSGVMYSYDGFGADLAQTVDLTNVNVLSFYAMNTNGASGDTYVYFDNVLVYTGDADTDSWTYMEIDTTSCSGPTVVKFLTLSDADISIDDVVASVGGDSEPDCPPLPDLSITSSDVFFEKVI